jgi:hypothetical protein
MQPRKHEKHEEDIKEHPKTRGLFESSTTAAVAAVGGGVVTPAAV